MVSLSLGMYLTAGIWSLIKGSQLEDDVRISMVNSAQFFERNEAHGLVWDTLHTRVSCFVHVNDLPFELNL